MRRGIRGAIGVAALVGAIGLAIPATIGAAGVSRQAQKSTQLPAATKQGWWVRVNPSTEAPYVHFRFGTVKNKLGSPITRTRTDPEFDAPEAQRTLEAVEIAALAMPPDKLASFCVFYGNQGVQLVEFKHEQALRVTRDQRAEACKP